jgi:peroxiredoxin
MVELPMLGEPPMLRVGTTAPDFTLPDTDGKPQRLSEVTGERPCVLIFYRGHW